MGAHTRGTLWREGKERGAGNWAGRYFRILYSSSCRMLLHPYTQAVWLSPGNTRNLTCRLWDIPQTLESCCVVRRRRKVDFLYGWRARNARHQPNNIDIPDILFRRERTQYNKKEQLFFCSSSSYFLVFVFLHLVWPHSNRLVGREKSTKLPFCLLDDLWSWSWISVAALESTSKGVSISTSTGTL